MLMNQQTLVPTLCVPFYGETFMQKEPTFNLWYIPWITVERLDGSLETVSLEQLLLNAHEYRGLYDPSPLVIMGIHRFLVAILQDIYDSKISEDLVKIWQEKQFLPDKIANFGQTYSNRFDLFHPTAPFYQSADIPLIPEKWGKGKSVGYLLPEQTAGTAVTHYNHLYDSNHTLCAGCAGKGLLLIPAFASSGGAGIKPSINGVPPIYILPGGDTYFHSLAASLTTPNYQPTIAKGNDVWWRRDTPTHVKRSQELLSVSYLYSLTFPARRVRLHPKHMAHPCPRCGTKTAWSVPEMTYQMGEYRPKDAAWWQDPFAAYRIKADKPAIPIRPVDGRAVWREFAGLFLPQITTDKSDKKTVIEVRPRIIDQMEQLRANRQYRHHLPYARGIPIPFQTIGLRTDMKMKIFEWEINGFQVPPNVLSDAELSLKIEDAIQFTVDANKRIQRVFSTHFGGDNVAEERLKHFKQRLSHAYWQALGDPFQAFILDLGRGRNECHLFGMAQTDTTHCSTDI